MATKAKIRFLFIIIVGFFGISAHAGILDCFSLLIHPFSNQSKLDAKLIYLESENNEEGTSHEIVAVNQNNEKIGFVKFSIFQSDENNQVYLSIDNLYVNEEVRKKGLALTLFNAATEVNENIDYVTSTMVKENKRIFLQYLPKGWEWMSESMFQTYAKAALLKTPAYKIRKQSKFPVISKFEVERLEEAPGEITLYIDLESARY